MNKINKYQKGKIIKTLFGASDLLSSIKTAARKSPLDFSDWGKVYRRDMLKVPGNAEIVSKLSDSELGYLLYHRNGQILNGTGSRYAIFNGSDPMSVKRINLFDNPDWNTGYLIPEYIDVVPETVSTHYVENLTGGLTKGVSEDLYNALMNITGMPLSANRIWKMPEITSKVYDKFNKGVINPEFTMSQEWLASDLGVATYKPKWWSSGSSWDDELKYLKQKADIDAGTWEGDELYNVNDDFYEDAVRFPIKKPRPVIQGTTRFIPTKHEFLFQINPQTIKNGTPIVNWYDPSIWLKNGGKIAKYQKGRWIGKGLKWLTTKADDAIKSVQRAHAIKSFNKGITQSKPVYQFNSGTGSFNFVVEKPLDYKFKYVKDLSDSEIKLLYKDLKTSGIVTPGFEFAVGKKYNPYFTYTIKPIDPKDAFIVSTKIPYDIDLGGQRSPEILENAIKEWFDVYYKPGEYNFGFNQLFPYVDQFSTVPVNLQRILVDQALDASKSIDYVSKSMQANNFLKKGLSNFSVPSFTFLAEDLWNSSSNHKKIELGFSPTKIVKRFDPDTKQWFKTSLPETVAHETAHSNTLFNTLGTRRIKRIKTESPEYGVDYIFIPKRWKKLLSPSTTKINDHDFEFAEGYSDLWGTRKSMYDMGIGIKASFDPNVKYNYWDLLRYKMTPAGMRDRFIKQRGGWWGGWKQQLDALNEIYKNGGKIEKHQKGKIITGLFKQWGDDVAKAVRNAKLNRALNTKTIKRYVDSELKFADPSTLGFKRPAPKILTMSEPLNIPANYSEFYKGLQDLSWKDPAFRQFTGYGAYPITFSQFDDVMGSIRSGIQNTKFADDVRQIIDVKSLSNPQHNSLENLIKFKTIDLNKVIGRGLESTVFKGSDPNYVLKTPHARALIGGQLPNGFFNWVNVSGKTVEEMYDNALAFANDFNGKHLFQEPISLIGYRRMRPMHYTGIPESSTVYIPVFKQLKANELFDEGLPGLSPTFLNLQIAEPTKGARLLPEQLVKMLDRSSSYKHLVPQAKSILVDFPKNNIFLENSQLQQKLADTHFGNWGIFDGKLRGIDLHKKGGTIK